MIFKIIGYIVVGGFALYGLDKLLDKCNSEQSEPGKPKNGTPTETAKHCGMGRAHTDPEDQGAQPASA